MRIVHLGLFFRKGNAGDIVIRRSVKSFLNTGEITFTEYNTRTAVDATVLADINASDGVLIGGGGLFWNNPRLDYASGWQWNIAPEVYSQIRVPICMYAVGDSSFATESLDGPRFRAFFAQSPSRPLIGLRNSGSYASVRALIGEHARLFYQPCPTSFLLHYEGASSPPKSRPLVISINIPMDRTELRYGSDDTLRRIAGAIADATKNVSLRLACHIESDLEFVPYMEATGARFEVAPLMGRPPRDIVDYYRQIDISVGGRAHAVLIPLGLAKPVVGVSSHNKIRWLFDDLRAPLPCVDVNAAHLREDLTSAIEQVIDEHGDLAERARANCDHLHTLSLENRRVIMGELFERRRAADELSPLAEFPAQRGERSVSPPT